MLFTEIIRMAFSSLGVNKLRSMLTMAGITIGLFSVVGAMTAVSALRGTIETGLSFLGTNIFQFSKYPTGITSDGNNRRKIELRRNVTLAQAQRYKKLMEDYTSVVCLKALDYNQVAQAVYGNRKTEPGLSLRGTDEHFVDANQYSVELGRNLTPEDVDFNRAVAVIGTDIQKKLFPNESPLGKRITVGGRSYLIVGAFAEKGSSFGQSQDDIVIVPITRFISDFGGVERFSINIATQAPSQQLYNDTIDKAITVMRIVRELKPEDENDFELYSNDSLIAAFAKIADVIRAGALVISGIALVAASVGIMNIMLVSVTERTKEIGIRKSIGARKVSILTQFLIEAVVLSVAGGLAGIALGAIAGNILAVMMKASIVFPWDWAFIGVTVCTVIGVGAGLYPAIKAASLDPIEALRYE